MPNSDEKPASPTRLSAGAAAGEARAERQAEALRQNLKRRKTQARGREGLGESGAERDPPTSESA